MADTVVGLFRSRLEADRPFENSSRWAMAPTSPSVPEGAEVMCEAGAMEAALVEAPLDRVPAERP